MKNKAKCKLCNTIIESFFEYDLARCKCGEIAIEGGTNYFKIFANNYDNFIRIDEQGNEIIVKVIEKNDPQPIVNDNSKKLTKKEKLEMLSEMIKAYENMPPHALSTACTNYDLLSSLMLLSAILQDDA
jgi:hypothetical protein